MMKSPRTSAIALAAGLLLLGAFHLSARARALRERVMTEDDRYYLPPSSWLRGFSAGYTEAAADIVWVKTVVYFGRQFSGSRDPVKHTMNYLLTAVELDPRFRDLYTIGSVLTLFQHQGEVTEASVAMAIELLERGVEQFPADGEILFQLGFMHYYETRRFYLDDPDSEEARAHREEGARLIYKAALMNGAPPYAARLAASIGTKAGLEDIVVEHLRTLLAKETEPELRALLADKLRAALGKAAERDIQETERLRAAWAASMPYVPFDFYLILDTDTPLAEWLDPLYSTNRLLDL